MLSPAALAPQRRGRTTRRILSEVARTVGKMAEEYVGVWWNGLHGPRTARRIYYLITEHGHTVRAEAGTDERRVRVWDLPDEELARARIQDLMEPEEGDPPGQVWRETTSIYRAR